MDHASKENIFDELNNFEKKKPTEIPPILEDYLFLIGKSGDIIFSWTKLKPLFKYKLDRVIKQFNEEYPAKDLAYSPNVDKFNYDDMRAKLLNAVEEFSGAPFTIQRLCELVMCPDKHYKRVDKFMRALEKDLLVVSTIEPLCKRQRTDSESSSLVNGVSETTGSLNGNVQSPPSIMEPNEETKVQSADEPVSQTLTPKEDVPVADGGESFDLKSNAVAKENESFNGENCTSGLTEEMETAISSSSTSESNKAQVQDIQEPSVSNEVQDTVKEPEESIPPQLPNENKIDNAEAESKTTVEEGTPAEVQHNSDLNDNDIVSDSSNSQQVSTCSEDQCQEKESGEVVNSDSETFKGDAIPELGDEPIPDSTSQADAPTMEFVTTSPQDSGKDVTATGETSLIPESSVQPEKSSAPEDIASVVISPDPCDVPLPEPEPMEEA